MIQQERQPPHDRKSQAQAFAAVALEIIDLIELLEHAFAVALRDPAAGVPDLDAQAGSATAADQDSAAIGVTHGVGDDVAQIRSSSTGSETTKAEQGQRVRRRPLRCASPANSSQNPFEQRADREGSGVRLDHAGVQLGDVQQRIEQAVHRSDGAFDLFHQPPHLVGHRMAGEGADKHAERMDRLAKVVARGCEKPRLRQIGFLRHLLLPPQILRQRILLEARAERFHGIHIGSPSQHVHRRHEDYDQRRHREVKRVALKYVPDQRQTP